MDEQATQAQTTEAIAPPPVTTASVEVLTFGDISINPATATQEERSNALMAMAKKQADAMAVGDVDGYNRWRKNADTLSMKLGQALVAQRENARGALGTKVQDILVDFVTTLREMIAKDNIPAFTVTFDSSNTDPTHRGKFNWNDASVKPTRKPSTRTKERTSNRKGTIHNLNDGDKVVGVYDSITHAAEGLLKDKDGNPFKVRRVSADGREYRSNPLQALIQAGYRWVPLADNVEKPAA